MESVTERQSLENPRLRSLPLAVTLELPAEEQDDTLLDVEAGRITGTVVRKRRRFPMWVTSGALLVVSYSALVCTAVLVFTAYTFNKARQPRAQNAVDNLFTRLQPILANITSQLQANGR